jgi:hypothetical protein
LNGVLSGFFSMDFLPQQPNGVQSGGPAVTVTRFGFDFHAHGMPFSFLDTDSGDWSWRRDPEREITITSLNPLTGQASLTVPVLLDADNLRGVYADTPLLAESTDGLPGEPIRFLENVNIAFPPLGQVTSAMDNCPNAPNADQSDLDADGVGDVCEGMFWVDANCSARVGDRDALFTLLRQGDFEVELPAACDLLGTQIGDVTVGDWNCDGQQNAADALVALREDAELPQGQDYGAGCPQPGEFIANPPPG